MSGIDERVFQIAEEVPDKAEHITNIYHLPHGARVYESYAARPMIHSCSGAMIGPNIALSAGHCSNPGGDPSSRTSTARFQTYPDRDPNQPEDEEFVCRELLSTWNQSDIKLWYCEPNDAGENPGEKYGYLDISVFDNSSRRDGGQTSVGDELFKIWINNIDELGLKDAVLYSEGEVTSKDSERWFCPSGTTSTDTDLWSQPGSSGASLIHAPTRRLVAGPQSTGATDGPGSNALSMYDTMKEAKVVTGHGNGNGYIWADNVRSIGLDPDDYYEVEVDKEETGLFDLLEDLHQITGLDNREIYWLGFDSPLRNSLWKSVNSSVMENYVEFLPDREMVHWKKPDYSDEFMFGLEPDHINLKENTEYRVTITVNTIEAQDDESFEIVFADHDGVYSYALDTEEGASWQTQSFLHETGSGDSSLFFMDEGVREFYLAAFSISEVDAYWDFDSADARYAWKNENNGRQGLMTEDGNPREGQTGANWAGVVERDPMRGTRFDDWSLRNARLGFLPETLYDLSFDYRNNSPADPLPEDASAAVRVRTGANQDVLLEEFSIQDSWERYSTRFKTGDGPSNLMFGVNTHESKEEHADGSYLVDNIRIQEVDLTDILPDHPEIDPDDKFGEIDLEDWRIPSTLSTESEQK